MSELLPCPFCGGEAKIAHSENGRQLKQTHDDSCWLSDATTVKAVIGEWDETKAIAAWNSRAERTCHIIKNSRKYVLSDGRELFDDGCSICNGYVGDGDNYCSNCGARVVSE